MQTNVNITSVTSNNKKVTKSLLNINPEISNTTLKEAAQLFTAISKNSFVEGTRINKIGLNEEYDPKQEPTLTVDNLGKITYNGDGILTVKIDDQSNSYVFGAIRNNNTEIIAKTPSSSVLLNNFSGTLAATEGENYAAKSVSFTVGG